MFCIWSTEHDDPSAGVIPGKVKHQLKGLLLVWKRGFMIWACQWVQVSIAHPTSNDSKIPAKGSPHSILNCWMTVSCLTRNGWMVQVQALLEISKIFEGLNTRHWSINFVTVGSSSGHRHEKKETWRPFGTTGFLSTNSFCKCFIL